MHAQSYASAPAGAVRPGPIPASAPSIADLTAPFHAAVDRAEALERALNQVGALRDWPRAPAGADPDAIALWTLRCDAIDASLGIPALDANAVEARKAVDAISIQIAALPAESVREVRVKTRALLQIHLDGEGSGTAAAFRDLADDLDRLAALGLLDD